MKYLVAKAHILAMNVGINTSRIYGVPQGGRFPELRKRDLAFEYYNLAARSFLIIIGLYALATGNSEIIKALEG